MRGGALDLGAAHPGCVDGDDLTRFNLADERRADDVESARLARHHVPGATRRVDVAEAAETQRPDAERVACGDQRVPGEKDEAVRALDARQRFGQCLLQRIGLGLRKQCSEHLGVAGGLEVEPLGDELVAQPGGVDEVPVVRDHHGADGRVLDGDGLRVEEPRTAGGAVPRVPDRDVALETIDDLLVEHLRDEPHLLADANLAAVTDRDARGLLSAMLQRVQAEVRQIGNVFARVEHPENATFLVKVVVVEGVHSGLITHARSMLLRAPAARRRVTRRCTESR